MIDRFVYEHDTRKIDETSFDTPLKNTPKKTKPLTNSKKQSEWRPLLRPTT